MQKKKKIIDKNVQAEKKLIRKHHNEVIEDGTENENEHKKC